MTTKPIPTKGLTDAALDWAVYKAEKGYNPQIIYGKVHDDCGWEYIAYSPSINWALAGPIIDRERITIAPHEKHGAKAWRALHMRTMLTGPTPLIAAMRCYVASKLGDSVDVPEELAQ